MSNERKAKEVLMKRMYQHAQKQGKQPDIRRIEREANASAHRVEAKKRK